MMAVRFFIWIILGLFVWPYSTRAQSKFEFTSNCKLAYQKIVQLKVKPAKLLLEAEKKENPNNVTPYFLENYIDFFELFFNESTSDYKRLKEKKAERLELCSQLSEKSPFTLFSQAVIKLQWAAVELKFSNRVTGVWDLRDAYKLAYLNQERFPDFKLNGIVTGPLQMMASSVPKNLKWAANLIGIKGSLQQGKAQFDDFMQANDEISRMFKSEGIFYQCYIQNYLLNKPEEALAMVEKYKLDIVNDHLMTYLAANLNLVNKRSDLTQRIIQNRARSSDYMVISAWDFEMAYAKLYHLEPDAGKYFENFLKDFKGNYYRKDAWLKYGYWHLIQGNEAGFRRCLNFAKTTGNTNSDADKRALKEAKLEVKPNLVLLRARLLNDGGYAREALVEIVKTNVKSLEHFNEKLEYMYRLARIYDDMGLVSNALEAYANTIKFGRSSTEYFAARAALQSGMIYEKSGDRARAISMYQTCINMEGHDYEESLEQRARAGLARCK